jgi:hypothetical protein
MPWGSVDLTEQARFILTAFGGPPQRILDVGVGFGSFGMTWRMVQLQMGVLIDKHTWNSHDDLMARENWMSTLDGIDAQDYSRSPGWLFYNTVHVGDAMRIMQAMPDDAYDVVVANDIVEHFAPDAVAAFTGELQRIAANLVIVGYPLTVTEVDDEGVERHLVVADPETILPGFTHKANLVDGWAVSFRLLGRLRRPSDGA